MTKLYLIRHGEAVDSGPGVSDGARWLTARGRAETTHTADTLHPKGRPTVIVTSPLVRAVQTAEVIDARDPGGEAIAVLDALATGDVAGVLRFIAAWKGDGKLALVGHEPTLSQVAAALLPRSRWPGFEKSAVAAFKRHDDAWSFGWMFLPRTSTTVDHLQG